MVLGVQLASLGPVGVQKSAFYRVFKLKIKRTTLIGGNTQIRNCTFNEFRTRIALAPHREFAAQKFGALAHASQTVVPGAAVFTQKLRVDTVPLENLEISERMRVIFLS